MSEERKQRMQACAKSAEAAYDEMYDTSYPTGCYSEAKDSYSEAIGIAEELGLTEEAQTMRDRLEHIKAVFRGQFS